MIYIIRMGGSGPYKIGYTICDDVRSRVYALQTGNPERLHVESVINGSLEDESALHRAYRDKRMVGEWFALSPQDVLDIIRSAFPDDREHMHECGIKLARARADLAEAEHNIAYLKRKVSALELSYRVHELNTTELRGEVA